MKPWADLPPPRHLLEEDVEDEDASQDRSISAKISLDLGKHNPVTDFVVLPTQAVSLMSNIGELTKIGEVEATFSRALSSSEEQSDYDEETQLYHSEEIPLQKPLKLQLYQIDSIVYLSIPSLMDPVMVNQLATQLLTHLLQTKTTRLIALAIDNLQDIPHCLTNTNVSVSLPPLQPPQYVTGPIAAFVSKAVTIHRDVVCFISSDTTDSLLDIAHQLKAILPIQDPLYLSKCSKSLSFSSSINGLYV